MREFKDSKGQVWVVEINMATAKRIKTLAGFDILNSSDSLLRMMSDDCLILDVAYAICHDQVVARNLNDESFAELFDGDAVVRARGAIMDELADFTPTCRREAVRKQIAALGALDKALKDRAATEMDRLNIQQIAEEAIRKTLGDTSGSSPERLESIPPTSALKS